MRCSDSVADADAALHERPAQLDVRVQHGTPAEEFLEVLGEDPKHVLVGVRGCELVPVRMSGLKLFAA
jgi:hypothetical protein